MKILTALFIGLTCFLSASRSQTFPSLVFPAVATPSTPAAGATIFSNTSNQFCWVDTAGIAHVILAPESAPTITGGPWLFNAVTPLQLASTSTGGVVWYNTSDQVTNPESFSIAWSGNILDMLTTRGGTGNFRSLIIGSAGGAQLQFRVGGTTSGQYNFTPSGNSTVGGVDYLLGCGTLTQSSGTSLGISMTGTLNQTSTAGHSYIKIASTETGLGSGNYRFLDFYAGSSAATNEYALNNKGIASVYGGVSTVGLGHPAVYGLDFRQSLTSGDGSATTLYTAVNGTSVFRITADIFATAAVTGTAIYTITWTQNSTTQTLVVNSTTLNTLATATDLITPDNSTAITSKLTGSFTGTFTVTGLVEQIK